MVSQYFEKNSGLANRLVRRQIGSRKNKNA